MGLLDDLIASSPIAQSMLFKPPQPDPEAQWKQEHKDMLGNYMLERFRDGHKGDPVPPSWETYRAGKVAERDAAAELERARQDVAEHARTLAENNAKIAKLQDEVRKREAEGRRKTAERRKALVDGAMAKIAADRALRGKRTLPEGELRSRASDYVEKTTGEDVT
jgi:hypothetical protein